MRLVVHPLERLGLTHVITRGVASTLDGAFRFSGNLDLLLELEPATVPRLVEAFRGGRLHLPGEETLLGEAERRSGGSFELVHRDSALHADVHLAAEDSFHHWALEHRRRIEVQGLSVWSAPLEYVIVRGLRHTRVSSFERHLEDVAMMVGIRS